MTDQPDSISVAFWILSAVILVAAFMVVSLRDLKRSAMFLTVCLAAVAGIFLLLDAQLLALVQTLVYAGAVSGIIFFAVKQASSPTPNTGKVIQTNQYAMVAFVVCIAFVLGVVGLVNATHIWRFIKEPLPEHSFFELITFLVTKTPVPFALFTILTAGTVVGLRALRQAERGQ